MGNDPYAQLEKDYKTNQDLTNSYLAEQRKIQEQQIGANTDYTINEINRNKGYADQNFNKEASAAYTDYQKSLNPYGVQAEQQAQAGLGGSGYAESSQVKNYNTYQNRYTNAKQTTDKIKADFDSKITEARLNGNTELAKIALQEYQTKMEMLKQELDFKTNITQGRVTQKNWQTEFDYNKAQNDREYQKYLEQMAYQKQQDALQQANWEKEYALSSRKSYGSNGSSGYNVTFGATGAAAGGNNNNTVTPAPSNEFAGYDMASINNLGYGPISKAQLRELVNSGKVILRNVNGVTVVEKAPAQLSTRGF